MRHPLFPYSVPDHFGVKRLLSQSFPNSWRTGEDWKVYHFSSGSNAVINGHFHRDHEFHIYQKNQSPEDSILELSEGNTRRGKNLCSYAGNCLIQGAGTGVYGPPS